MKFFVINLFLHLVEKNGFENYWQAINYYFMFVPIKLMVEMLL